MWKKGPLPPNTYNWGGIVLKGENLALGFHFADFKGDHAQIDCGNEKVLAEDVLLYNNSLEMPPTK